MFFLRKYGVAHYLDVDRKVGAAGSKDSPE